MCRADRKVGTYMASIPKNFEVLGILLLLTAAGNHHSFSLPRLSFLSSLSGPGQERWLENFARDMHRVVDVVDQVSNMGHLVLPRDGSHVGGAARAVSASLSNPQNHSLPDLSGLNLQNLNLQNLSLPDLQQMMEVAGPLMAMLGMNESSGKK